MLVKPLITYKRNKSLDEIIGGHTLQGGKFFKTHLQIINHATQQIIFVLYTSS